MPPKRARYSGDEKASADAVSQALKSAVFFKYPEAVAGKIDPSMLKKAGPLLQALLKVQPNLSFTRTMVMKAMELLLKERGSEWDIKPDEHATWCRSSTNRLRCMCRHLYQALRRKPVPKWVADVVGEVCLDTGADDDDGQDNTENADDEEVHEGEESEDEACHDEEGGEEEEEPAPKRPRSTTKGKSTPKAKAELAPKAKGKPTPKKKDGKKGASTLQGGNVMVWDRELQKAFLIAGGRRLGIHVGGQLETDGALPETCPTGPDLRTVNLPLTRNLPQNARAQACL
jgi:hypothetical protein